jgi:amidase
VSRVGVAPAESSLDCVGPFARDMRTLIAAMAGIGPAFDIGAASDRCKGINIACVSVEAEADILEAVQNAVDRVGGNTRSIELHLLQEAFDAGLAVINAETSRAFGHLAGAGRLGADLEARLRLAATTTAAQLEAAEQVRRRFTAAVDHALADVDVLVMPTLPTLPITVEAARNGTSVIAMSSLIRPFNLSGHPALSMPISVAGSSLKAGLQIIGRKGADERVCAVAACFEAALGSD